MARHLKKKHFLKGTFISFTLRIIHNSRSLLVATYPESYQVLWNVKQILHKLTSGFFVFLSVILQKAKFLDFKLSTCHINRNVISNPKSIVMRNLRSYIHTYIHYIRVYTYIRTYKLYFMQIH
jgi:hypothetical protein